MGLLILVAYLYTIMVEDFIMQRRVTRIDCYSIIDVLLVDLNITGIIGETDGVDFMIGG
jgi:hypothetical protein